MRNLREFPERFWGPPRIYGAQFKNHFLALRLQRAHEHKDWRTDWQHVVFSDEPRFNLWNHDDCIRRHAGECCLQDRIIERHSDQTPRVMVWV
ncbi:transposable element Tcb1 transposase [Trichonephila clavipes]|uniref:Transposable element Tcb1 transposase n=1 Tax=Trichonephila clavipes TaxID=2585209 RepID=A0A8X6VBT6_TRICX|nr:transposable element Tcb1 transposase [Trichonephila clavipes]